MPGLPEFVRSLRCIRLFQTCLSRTNSGRPGTLDVSDDGRDLVVRQSALEGWHVALVTRRSVGFKTVLGYAEQVGIRMMPCVPCLIMRWRWQATVRQSLPPVGLPLEFPTVTACAAVGINGLSNGHLPGICRVNSR